MKKTGLILVGLIAICTSAFGQGNFFDDADQFFSRYIKGKGVLYQEVKQNPQQMDALLAYVESNGTLEVNSDNDKALLINSYNLAVIKGIVEEYPVGSPQRITAFFDTKRITIAGQNLSLNDLEKEILLKQTNDPRLHFALVCGAKGCPQIISRAYRPEKLDEQLDEQTRLALNDENFIQVDDQARTVKLSQIFEWYRKEFLQNRGSVLPFINRYRVQNIRPESKISYYSYDWTLNDSGTPEKEVVTTSTSNLLQFTPSQLFAKGQYEINVFNNLYSQTKTRDRQGDEVSFGGRASILTSTIQWTYGVSKNAKVNAGLDLVLSAGAGGLASGSNHFQLFSSDKSAGDFAVAAVGARIKFQPIKKFSFYSVQTGLLIPVAKDLEGVSGRGTFLALNRYLWRTQFFYDFKLTRTLRLFYEFDINYYMRRNKQDHFFLPNFVDLPSSLFFNYFPNGKLNLFLSGQYAGRYGNSALKETNPNAKFGLLQWYLQLGAGAKYQVTSNLGFEISYGNFVSGRGLEGFEVGAGQVWNLGIRYIR
ncbi:MAG: DUF547 domain-containing protein [Cyclobacteriaceae bacterium]